MNTTLHLIGKDIRHFRWTIVLWLASYAYLFFFQQSVSFRGNAELADYFRLITILTVGVIGCAMLIGIIQQDHPTDSGAFWRTRPISPGRLVGAKLALITGLFVGVPLLTVAARGWFGGGLVMLGSLREYALMVLVLGSVVLSLAAAAACTSNIAYALLLWLGIVFGTGALDAVLGRFWPQLTLRTLMQMNINRMISIVALSAAVSLAIILNQYLRRKLSTSIILLAVGAIGSALMGMLWGYYYFYQG